MTNGARSDSIVRGFALSSMFWLLVGLLVGLWLAAEMIYPALNLAPWLAFGRLRVVHTNGLVFGFTLAGIFACGFYMLEKLTRAPLAFPVLAKIQLWLFNIAIALAALSLFAGLNTSKEYSELEWPLDIVVVVLWVMFAVNVMGTLVKRREKQMYVSLWFLVGCVVTVAVVYILNNLAIPASLTKSYSAYSGVNDANVQWWFGHNAVASVFTFPILAMFYYFLPKSTGLPIYSHRLSIIAFWSLVFGYLWTGAHHLMLTPVPERIWRAGAIRPRARNLCPAASARYDNPRARQCMSARFRRRVDTPARESTAAPRHAYDTGDRVCSTADRVCGATRAATLARWACAGRAHLESRLHCRQVRTRATSRKHPHRLSMMRGTNSARRVR